MSCHFLMSTHNCETLKKFDKPEILVLIWSCDGIEISTLGHPPKKFMSGKPFFLCNYYVKHAGRSTIRAVWWPKWMKRTTCNFQKFFSKQQRCINLLFRPFDVKRDITSKDRWLKTDCISIRSPIYTPRLLQISTFCWQTDKLASCDTWESTVSKKHRPKQQVWPPSPGQFRDQIRPSSIKAMCLYHQCAAPDILWSLTQRRKGDIDIVRIN